MSITHELIIRAMLSSSSAWRDKVTKTFADDQRNLIAKRLLENLATDDVPPEIIAELDRYSENEVQRECMVAAKAVGFKSFPGSLTTFVREVVSRIEASRAEWKSAFQKEGVR
jgi:hypothetical protein